MHLLQLIDWLITDTLKEQGEDRAVLPIHRLALVEVIQEVTDDFRKEEHQWLAACLLRCP